MVKVVFQYNVAKEKQGEYLKVTQGQYLLTLGKEFDSQAYFEGRLRIGVVHAEIGLPLSVYQCAYSNLIHNIINVFPRSITDNNKDYSDILKFLVKITSLDISLAIETYHSSHVTTLEASVKEYHSRENQLRTKAETDALTGLYNRGTAFNHLAKLMENFRLGADMLYVLMVDLDHFKKVNDIYGHPAGDLVLQQAAKGITQAVRDHDIVGRYGGEEFIIVLTRIDSETANIVAKRILTRIAETPIETNNQTIKITASIGLTCFNPGDDIQNLVQRADIALYAAKNAGRNCIVIG